MRLGSSLGLFPGFAGEGGVGSVSGSAPSGWHACWSSLRRGRGAGRLRGDNLHVRGQYAVVCIVDSTRGNGSLALEQAGAFVAKHGLSFSEYRQRWDSRKAEVLAWYDKRLMNYSSSVAVTWQTTFEELSHSERKLLNILAWLAPEPISLSLLEGNVVDDADARDALAGLASWSLVRWMADREAVTVHRLVQEITRHRLSR
jgi:hypothetical protein